MPLYQLTCTVDTCDTTFEEFISLTDYPATPACPRCGSPTYRDLRKQSTHGPADPVVIYQAPDGTYRFPPSTTGVSTAHYDALGYTRHELRGWADVRRMEGKINDREMSEVRRRVEKQAEQHERAESERRSVIRHGLEQGFFIPELDSRGRPTGRKQRVELTARGRDLMAAAQSGNDHRGPRVQDAGFHVDAYSNDRSNRERDPRRRDQ